MHKYPTNTDLLRVHRSVRPILYYTPDLLGRIICSTDEIADTYYARSSEVMRNSLLKTWDQSDVDPMEFK